MNKNKKLTIYSPKFIPQLVYLLGVYLVFFLFVVFSNKLNLIWDILGYVSIYLGIGLFLISFFFIKKVKVIENKYVIIQNYGFKKISFFQEEITSTQEIKAFLYNRFNHFEVSLNDGRVIRIFEDYIKDYDQLKAKLKGEKKGLKS